MPEHTPEDGGAGTAPAETEDAEPRTPNAEPRTFTQEDVDRIVTERLRRERQRVEKAVRDEFEGRIAELEAAGEQAQQARGDVETLSGALRSAENRALIAERPRTSASSSATASRPTSPPASRTRSRYRAPVSPARRPASAASSRTGAKPRSRPKSNA
jgi:NADH dehydrogenase/NADH:ubiquinone oxidoreductase subunit G